MKVRVALMFAILLACNIAYAGDNSSVNLNALKPKPKYNNIQKIVNLKQEQVILKRLKEQAKEKHFANYYNATNNQLRNAGNIHVAACPSHKPSARSVSLEQNKKSLKQKKPKGIPAFQYSRFANFPPPPKVTTTVKKYKKKPIVLRTLPDVFVKPEVITKVKVSNRDVNRIVSPSPITGIVYSKEKGVMVSYMGRNAFLKFAIKKIPYGGYEYISVPTELYIITQDGIYTVIAQPTAIMGRTIRLTGGTLNKIKKNRAMFSQLPYEKKLIKIIKAVYMDKIPSTWDVLHPNVKPARIGALTAKLLELINITGTGFSVKEYEITAKIPTRISEKDFISTKLSRSPAAITLTHFLVSPDNPSYLFIVERKGGEHE